jgi:hypothetical protein
MEQSLSWEGNSHSANQETPCLFGTQRFIIIFTIAHHYTLSIVRCIQSTPSHLVSLSSIFILFSHVHLDLPNGLFPSGFQTKILHAFLISPTCATCSTHLSVIQYILFMCFFLIPSEVCEASSTELLLQNCFTLHTGW